MTANVELTDTFGTFRSKTNELVVMTSDGMNNSIKVLDTTDSTSNITGSIVTAGGIGVTGSGTIGGNFNVHGNLHANGNITSDGSLTFGDADTDNVVFGADVNSHIIPNTDDTYDLGSSAKRWKDLYVDGSAYIDAINLNGTVISATAAQINYNRTTKLGTAEVSKTVTSDAAGNVTFVDGTCNIDIASHDGTNGLELGGTLVTSSATELNLLNGVSGLVQADFTKLAAVDASATELDYNNITTLGTAEVSKTVTSDAAGNVTFVDGTNDIDIASHDGSNGLKLGGVLVTKTATELNTAATGEDATAVAVSMAIALG